MIFCPSLPFSSSIVKKSFQFNDCLYHGGFLPMTPSRAEIVAIQAVEWISGQDELLPVFLGSTGASVTILNEALHDPAAQASLLEFLTMDDVWVLQFCEGRDVAPEEPFLALQVLAGQGRTHWT